MIFSILKVSRNRERCLTASVRHFPLCDMLLVLQSEIPSGICAKLRTVATSNNRDHPIRSLWSSPFKHNQLFTRFTSIVKGHSPRSLHRDHSIIACSRHIHIFLFFAHIRFVVNHTINATPAERLQQYLRVDRYPEVKFSLL